MEDSQSSESVDLVEEQRLECLNRIPPPFMIPASPEELVECVEQSEFDNKMLFTTGRPGVPRVCAGGTLCQDRGQA